ncbi:hypothetical protein HY626_03845 [Candidatus Uhrbacteria bacterium]|nr:hypothetical protein [Candidatus Uhrbacteria bacterium]
MKILVVEDDHLQRDWIRQQLQQELNAQIDVIKTELDFRSRLEEITKNPPDVIIMDIMLRWTDPNPAMEPQPEDVKMEGFFRAGLRCEKLLASDERTKNIPVILYTVLANSDLGDKIKKLGQNIFYVPKDSDIRPLARWIRGLVRRH